MTASVLTVSVYAFQYLSVGSMLTGTVRICFSFIFLFNSPKILWAKKEVWASIAYSDNQLLLAQLLLPI